MGPACPACGQFNLGKLIGRCEKRMVFRCACGAAVQIIGGTVMRQVFEQRSTSDRWYVTFSLTRTKPVPMLKQEVPW